VLFDTNSASCFKTELYRINNINYEYEKGMWNNGNCFYICKSKY
jgi:hypothetical protein